MQKINYGFCSPNSIFLEAENIANDIVNDNVDSVVDKMNRIFFGGGALDPKHVDFVINENRPLFGAKILTQKDFPLQESNFKAIDVKKDQSCYLFGYIEGIPLLGSILAMFALISNQFRKMHVEKNITLAAREIKNLTNTNDENVKLLTATKILTLATQYTQYRNKQIGSLLALIPFIKPLVRAIQIAIPLVQLINTNQNDFQNGYSRAHSKKKASEPFL